MNMKRPLLYAFAGLLVLGCISVIQSSPPSGPEIPPGWPEPAYPMDTAYLKPEIVQLGRRLFYDPVLSRDSTISCSSCHLSYTAFTHVDHTVSHGIDGKIGTRNSPVLINLAWTRNLMWDGAVNHIDVQSLAPISNPLEMDESIAHVVEKLQQKKPYRAWFAAAWGDSVITGQRVVASIGRFMLTLVSSDAKYDKVMRGEPGSAFTDQEKRGLELFRTHCSTCHPEPLFTTNGFANNGLAQDTFYQDTGRMKITGLAADSLTFKIPTLRNIEHSYPYMHDGRFQKLSQVLNHYVSGIQESPTLAPALRGGILLSHEQRTDILAFLLTLTDTKFLFNPAHSFPR